MTAAKIVRRPPQRIGAPTHAATPPRAPVPASHDDVWSADHGLGLGGAPQRRQAPGLLLELAAREPAEPLDRQFELPPLGPAAPQARQATVPQHRSWARHGPE